MISGPAGLLEATWLASGKEIHDKDNSTLAIICHPHTLYGGNMAHKVVSTLSRACQVMNFDVVKFNFRGAGKSEGFFDNGWGEQHDLAAVIHAVTKRFMYSNFVLAGFSFGAYVVSAFMHNAVLNFQQYGQIKRLILVGAPINKWNFPQVPYNTIIVHGEQDELIPVDLILSWGEKMKVSIEVLEAADHFFSGQLHVLREKIISLW